MRENRGHTYKVDPTYERERPIVNIIGIETHFNLISFQS